MAHKLKDLEITNVDFVDEGANKGADILITKNRDGKSGLRRAWETIAKALGLVDETDDTDSVEKSAHTFEEMTQVASMEKINDEVWSITRAIRESLWSILTDTEIADDDRLGLMEQSIDQFTAAAKAASAKWASGKLSNISKSKDGDAVQKNESKGDVEDMIKIDKSKMSEEERKAYEALIEKFKVEVPEDGEVSKASGAAAKTSKVDPEENEEDVEEEKPAKTKKADKTCKSKEEPTEDDVYKGLNPAVKAELESLKKFKDDIENQQLTQVAKKYEVLGKKPEDLVPTLKSLKAAGGTAYDDMIAVLDSAVQMTEQSGMFSEVGKSNHGSAPAHVAKSAAEGKIETIAKEFMEKNPNLGYTQAVAKAWAENPDIYDEYESESHQ